MTSAVERSEEVSIGRAWPRFWARLLDIQLYSIPIAFLLAAIFPQILTSDSLSGRSGDLVIGFISLPFVMMIDAVILSLTGTSPGKALAALTLVSEEGDGVAISTAIARNLQVYLKGLVLGIPILFLFGYINGYNSIQKNGITEWDAETGTRIVSRDQSGARTWLVGFIAVVVLLVATGISQTANRAY